MTLSANSVNTNPENQIFDNSNTKYGKLLAKIELGIKCPDEPILSVQEAAFYLGVATGTISNWVAKGIIKPDRLKKEPRFRVKNLQKLFR